MLFLIKKKKERKKEKKKKITSALAIEKSEDGIWDLLKQK